MTSPVWMLASIALPLAGGIWLLIRPIPSPRARNIVLETLTCLASLFVLTALWKGSREAVTLYSFAEGFSITFRLDGLGSVFAGMVAVMWPAVTLYAFEYMERDQAPSRFFAFFLMTYGIALSVAYAGNLTTMYVFFEMLTLVTIPLVTHYGGHDSMYAGRKYAVYTIGGASLGFFAVVLMTILGRQGLFVYGGSMPDGSTSAPILRLAFLFGFFGFGVKAAIFPLHDWLPTASVAPTPVTALLHAVAVVNSGVFAIIRLTWYVCGVHLLAGSWTQKVCLGAAIFTVVYAAVAAVRERHFKRRLAYSTVSNLSYMLLGVMLLTPEGLRGGIAHMLFHGVIKLTLFMCAGCFMHMTEREYVYELNGCGRRMPWTFGLYTVGALSLTGLPLLCGFVSKWALVEASLETGGAWGVTGAVALIVSAFLCAVYTLTVSARAFFPAGGSISGETAGIREAGVCMLLPVGLFTLVDVALGVWPGPIMDLIGRIAGGLL